MREPATHAWPALNVNTDARVTPIAAASRSASSSTMLGDLPPSSKIDGVNVSAAAFWMRRRRCRGAGHRDLGDVDMPDERIADVAEPGDDVDGARGENLVEQLAEAQARHGRLLGRFTTTVLPAASVGPTLLLSIATGMLYGTIAATTPYGSRSVSPSVLASSGTVRPVDASRVSCALRSQRSTITPPHANWLIGNGVPLSVDSRRASSSP